MRANLNLQVEIADAEIALENYSVESAGDSVPGQMVLAVNQDLDMYRDGELSLEDVISNFGGEVTITLQGIKVQPQEESE